MTYANKIQFLQQNPKLVDWHKLSVLSREWEKIEDDQKFEKSKNPKTKMHPRLSKKKIYFTCRNDQSFFTSSSLWYV